MPVFVSVLILFALVVVLLIVLNDRIRIKLLRGKLQSEMRQKVEIGNFLNLFSKNITNFDDQGNWMNVSARYVADLTEAYSVCLFIRNGDELSAQGIAGAFPLMRTSSASDQYAMSKTKYILELIRKEKIRIGNGIIGKVAESMFPVLITDPADPRLADFDTSSSITSLMAAPLIFEGECIGVVCAVNNRRDPEHPFDIEQYTRLKFITGQLVLAQNILQAYSNRSKQQRLFQELDFARNLQRSLLPTHFPEWGKFQIHAFSRASKEVSGDFYDFVEIDKNRMLVVIGDACGKGIPACMIMAMTRSFIRAHVDRFTTLKQLLIELNENLYRDTGDGRYITIGICLLDKKESTLEYARAGHTELLIFIRNHIRSIYPDGSALGLLPSDLADFDTITLEFSPNMEIMLFTDGINEAVSPFGEQFGVERIKNKFIDSCEENDMPGDSVKRLMDAVDDFTEHPDDQSDDQTIVIIRHQ